MRETAIRVYRPESRGDPDRNAPYRVSVDGKVVGDLWSGQTVLDMVFPGEHSVQVLANQTVSWFSSNEVAVIVDRSRPSTLMCKLRAGLPTVNLLFRRKNYLALQALSAEESQEILDQVESRRGKNPPPRNLGALLKEGKDLSDLL